MRVTIVQNDLDFVAGQLTALGIKPDTCIVVADHEPQTHVFRYEWGREIEEKNDALALRLIFSSFNCDESRLPTIDPRRKRLEAYRKAGMRSLSVGDVVWLGGRGYRCMPRGWLRVDAPKGCAVCGDTRELEGWDCPGCGSV